jgi:HEAT repeat protein
MKNEFCPICGRGFTELRHKSVCDWCERTICSACSHRDVPDHHYTTCQDCLEGMDPYHGISGKTSEELLSIINNSSWTERNDAIRLLGERREKEAIPGIISVLADKSSYVRSSAATALGKLNATEAVEELVKVAETDADHFVRSCAIQSLYAIRDPRAVNSLLKALNDESYSVRGHAVLGLWRMGIKAAVPEIRKLFETREGEWGRREALNALLYFDSDLAGELLPEALGSGDSAVLGTALKLSAKHDFPGREKLLGQFLQNEDEKLRLEALHAWEEIYEKEGISVYESMLSDDYYLVRSIASMYLRRYNWKGENKQQLARYYFASDQWAYLDKMGVEIIPVCEEIAEIGTPMQKTKAIYFLSKMQFKQAEKAIELFLEDERRAIRLCAAKTLLEKHPGHSLAKKVRDEKEEQTNKPENGTKHSVLSPSAASRTYARGSLTNDLRDLFSPSKKTGFILLWLVVFLAGLAATYLVFEFVLLKGSSWNSDSLASVVLIIGFAWFFVSNRIAWFIRNLFKQSDSKKSLV